MEKAHRRHGDRQEPAGVPRWTRAVEKELEAKLKADEMRVVDTDEVVRALHSSPRRHTRADVEFDFAVIADHWRFLASGVGVSLALAALSGVTSIAAGSLVALGRLLWPRWLRPIVVLYIDSMRAIPVLVVLVWAFFALRSSRDHDGAVLRRADGADRSSRAYAAEIFRRGIESVRPGQTRASLALGMSQAQIVRRIVLPQAVVRMLPRSGRSCR